jgi:viroplasmin and RNaseH domain-containing protein
MTFSIASTSKLDREECKAQVDGHPGNRFQKFADEQEAVDFVNRKPRAIGDVIDQKTYYLVLKGRQPGLYADW